MGRTERAFMEKPTVVAGIEMVRLHEGHLAELPLSSVKVIVPAE
jgi:hypothetical protein